MDHARKINFLQNYSGMSMDNQSFNTAVTRMNKLQDGAFSTIDWGYNQFGMKWYASQPEFGVTKD